MTGSGQFGIIGLLGATERVADRESLKSLVASDRKKGNEMTHFEYWQIQEQAHVDWIKEQLADKASEYYGDRAVEAKRKDWNHLVWLHTVKGKARRMDEKGVK